MVDSKHPMHPDQLVFWELVKRSERNRALLSRIALELSGLSVPNGVWFSELLNQLTWPEYHGVLAMLLLRSEISLQWSNGDLNKLEKWAKSPD